MTKCIVKFDNGITKEFVGHWKKVIKDIMQYCMKEHTETISAKWEMTYKNYD